MPVVAINCAPSSPDGFFINFLYTLSCVRELVNKPSDLIRWNNLAISLFLMGMMAAGSLTHP